MELTLNKLSLRHDQLDFFVCSILYQFCLIYSASLARIVTKGNLEQFVDSTICFIACSSALTVGDCACFQLGASLQSTCAANVFSKWGNFARPFR
jgi:hypothetical protein